MKNQFMKPLHAGDRVASAPPSLVPKLVSAVYRPQAPRPAVPAVVQRPPLEDFEATASAGVTHELKVRKPIRLKSGLTR